MPKGKSGVGRRRVFPINARHQLQLFPEAMRPTAKEFAGMLLGRNLIAATHKGINVEKMVENAYANIERFQGIDVNALLQTLATAKQLDVELLCGKAVEPMRRSLKEQWEIKRAVKAIVLAVRWKQKADSGKKLHAPSPAERVEKAQQQRHLESIQQ
ncbi:MAG: hypothetical protein Q8N60_05505 [Candidatus Diapherotrites archaeon]|nr:hypothetical protein [Candidatus Diapherotrites archaeon]